MCNRSAARYALRVKQHTLCTTAWVTFRCTRARIDVCVCVRHEPKRFKSVRTNKSIHVFARTYVGVLLLQNYARRHVRFHALRARCASTLLCGARKALRARKSQSFVDVMRRVDFSNVSTFLYEIGAALFPRGYVNADTNIETSTYYNTIFIDDDDDDDEMLRNVTRT